MVWFAMLVALPIAVARDLIQWSRVRRRMRTNEGEQAWSREQRFCFSVWLLSCSACHSRSMQERWVSTDWTTRQNSTGLRRWAFL